jgi:hypothetical protein
VKGWLTRWPNAIAALAIAAEGAHPHPYILEFSYSRELPKMVSALFSFEAIRGSGLGRLAEFRQDESGVAAKRRQNFSSQLSARPEKWSGPSLKPSRDL